MPARVGATQGLLSHVDPHMTLGQIVARAVREAVERHDPARPPRGRRIGSRAASSGANETSAPKDASGPNATAARRNAAPTGDAGETSAPKDAVGSDPTAAQPNATPTGGAASPAKEPADINHRYAAAAKRPDPAARPGASAPKDAAGPESATAESTQRPSVPAGVAASPAKAPGNSEHRDATAKRPGVATSPSAPKKPAGSDSATASARPAAMPIRVTTSPAKAEADTEHGRAVAAKPPTTAAQSATSTSAPKAECSRQRQGAPSQLRVRGRTIPTAVKRQVWERDGGCCSYVDRGSGRRCRSRHALQMDHVLPFALGGSAEPDNLRLLCAAHHRHRHADGGGRADCAAAEPTGSW